MDCFSSSVVFFEPAMSKEKTINMIGIIRQSQYPNSKLILTITVFASLLIREFISICNTIKEAAVNAANVTTIVFRLFCPRNTMENIPPSILNKSASTAYILGSDFLIELFPLSGDGTFMLKPVTRSVPETTISFWFPHSIFRNGRKNKTQISINEEAEMIWNWSFIMSPV